VLAERPVPDDEDVMMRDRVRTRRSGVLAVDVSGSMRCERVHTAAATVAALDTSGEQDLQLAPELARAGQGRLAQVRTYRDVAPALSRIFAD